MNLITEYHEILEHVLKCGSNNLGAFGGNFEGGYNLQQVPEEISSCLKTIIDGNHKISRYLEIGCASLGLTRLISDILQPEEILTIDLEDNDWPNKKDNIESIIKQSKTFNRIIGNSHNIKFINYKFDLIVIDGDHSYNGVKEDYLYYSKFLDDNGWLFFHDTHNIPGVDVSKLHEELKSCTDNNIKYIQEFVGPSTYKGIGLYRKC